MFKVQNYDFSFKISRFNVASKFAIYMYNMLDGSKCNIFSRELRVLSGDVMGGREQRKKGKYVIGFMYSSINKQLCQKHM